MSIENKITIIGTKGTKFKNITNLSSEGLIMDEINRIVNAKCSYDGLGMNTINDVMDFAYTPLDKILKTITPKHINTITLCFLLYEYSEEMPWLYHVATTLFDNNEQVEQILIENEDS